MEDTWQPAFTAPTNGYAFEYLTKNGKIKHGSLASNCGGEIKRDPDMISWRPINTLVCPVVSTNLKDLNYGV